MKYNKCKLIIKNIIMQLNSSKVVILSDYQKTPHWDNSSTDVTKNQIDQVLSNNYENLKKDDIIWALINITNINPGEYLAMDLLNQDYKKLLYSLYIQICENFWAIFHVDSLDLQFDKDEFNLYLIDKNSNKKYKKLEISLIPNQDFSETHIKIYSDKKLIFLYENIKNFWRI